MPLWIAVGSRVFTIPWITVCRTFIIPWITVCRTFIIPWITVCRTFMGPWIRSPVCPCPRECAWACLRTCLYTGHRELIARDIVDYYQLLLLLLSLLLLFIDLFIYLLIYLFIYYTPRPPRVDCARHRRLLSITSSSLHAASYATHANPETLDSKP